MKTDFSDWTKRYSNVQRYGVFECANAEMHDAELQ